MKKQKFTVHFTRRESVSVVVEATSYEEAFDEATDGEDVILNESCTVRNNKTGTVKDFTEQEETDCYESPWSS